MPVEVVLHQPEIAQNTGNVARTCAAVGARLHLVHPLGFYLTDRHLRRAGVDYWPLVTVTEHPTFAALLAQFPERRLWLFSGQGQLGYDQADYRAGDLLVFGSESQGLPPELLDLYPQRLLRIPMVAAARSLNLANAVAVGVYAAVARIRPPWFQNCHK